MILPICIAGSLYGRTVVGVIVLESSEAATRLITIKLLSNYFNRPNFYLTIIKHGPSILVGLLVDPESWFSFIMSYAQQKTRRSKKKKNTLALIKVCTKENADRERLVPEVLPMSGHNRSQWMDNVTADTISQSYVSVFLR
ncbi:hypothetical protein CY34DRAFT_379247 [Suillus luteus UH-Slu-Lm8-n1]|uniref:Unplaced genomic scaffold CY34scaffold_25, whole genome shotgun sequence n=1 Tax=Suillus luteus UH-Slu-Lm8-n1 TaxID=930992 RepID=A0A0D0BL14_9AGAM|nr:hypothetical protein CY34DRAFT_379247 [Suillus luteus UH-Slu-Lm8-n1]